MTFAQLKGLARIYADKALGKNAQIEVAPLLSDFVNNVLERVYTSTKSLVGSLTLSVVGATASYSLVESASGTTPAKHWFTIDSIKWQTDEDITHKQINPRHLAVSDTTTDPPYWFINNEQITFHPTPAASHSPVIYGAYYPVLAADTEIVDISSRDFRLVSLGLKAMIESTLGNSRDGLALDNQFEQLLTYYRSPYLRQHEQTVLQYDMIGE